MPFKSPLPLFEDLTGVVVSLLLIFTGLFSPFEEKFVIVGIGVLGGIALSFSVLRSER